MLDLLLVALLQASMATTEPAAAPAATTEPAAAQTETQEPVRCRMVRVEGSNLRQRRCTTPSEDEALHSATSRELREMQSQSGRGAREPQ